MPPTGNAKITRPTTDWSQLVLDERCKRQLEAVVHRVEHRATVQDGLLADSGDARAKSCVVLMHGVPGTGKTLVAKALSARLGLPLCTVDLRVVSKYIGETEKRLGDLFDLAEGFRAILFFDEADSLFAKRTQIGDANDRYANLQTNFLLGAVDREVFTVLCTNRLQGLDDALERRIHFNLELRRPSRSAQADIWRLHLPSSACDEGVDLGRLTRQFDLVGGEIRNCIESAAYEAAARGSSIDQSILERACEEELIKKGQPLPTT